MKWKNHFPSPAQAEDSLGFTPAKQTPGKSPPRPAASLYRQSWGPTIHLSFSVDCSSTVIFSPRIKTNWSHCISGSLGEGTAGGSGVGRGMGSWAELLGAAAMVLKPCQLPGSPATLYKAVNAGGSTPLNSVERPGLRIQPAAQKKRLHGQSLAFYSRGCTDQPLMTN